MNIFPMLQTVYLAGQLIDTKTSTTPLIEMTDFKPKYDFSVKSSCLERCRPEDEGIESDVLLELIKKLSQDKNIKLHSITIARNGRIVCEAALGAQKIDVWKHSFSACKSVTSLAIGMLIDDGILSLNEKIVNIFKDEVTPLSRIRLKELCVEDLLTMRSTVTFSEGDSMADDDWVKAFLNFPTKGVIGKTFKYNSLNTYMLSAIVTKKTGKTLSEFLDSRLFKPLGIRNYYWEKCPKGIDKGGWGLYIRPEDFIKIGTVVINCGIYNGKRIISEKYIKNATAKHVEILTESERYDYGYQIWVDKVSDTFLFNGMLGQNLLGFKRNGIVVLANAGNSEMFQQGNFFKYLDEAFNRDFPNTVSFSKKSYKALCAYVHSLSLYNNNQRNFINRIQAFKRLFVSTRNLNDNFRYFDKKTFKVHSGENNAVGILPLVLQSVENCYSKGFVGIRFQINDNKKIEMLYMENDGKFVIPLGIEKPEMFNLEYRSNNFLVASSAKFTHNEDDEEVLLIRLDFLETPSSRIIKIYRIDDYTINVVQSESPGADFIFRLSDMMISEYADKPIIKAMLDRFGTDYIGYRIEKIFNSNLILKLKT